MRLAEREAERAARRVKAAQEQEAAKQLSMAQRGMTEEEKEVCMLKASKGKRERERERSDYGEWEEKADLSGEVW